MRLLNFLSLLILFSSCGEMFMEKKEESKLTKSMEINPDALSNILTKPIGADLSTIEEALEFFVDIVKTDRVGFLSLTELKKYLKQVMKDVDSEILGMLDAVFEINSLLTGDDKLYIKKENIKKIVSILKVVNYEFVRNNVHEYFESKKELTYFEHLSRKSQIYSAFHIVKKEIQKHYKLSHNSFDIMAFANKFRTKENSEVIDTLKDLLFVKKIFLGGDKEKLTSKEFQSLISMMDSGAKIVYDTLHISYVTHAENQSEPIIATLTQNIETMIKNLYYPTSSTEKLFDLDELKKALGRLITDAGPFLKYDKSILKLKDIFLLNNSVNFGADEIRFLLSDLVLKNLKKGGFFLRTYKDKEDILGSPNVITKDLEGIITTSSEESSFKNDFNRIAKDYWFFKGDEFSATYGSELKRSAFGMYEIAVYEDIAMRLISYYSQKDGSSYLGYKLTFEQLVQVITDFDDFLIGEGMLLEGRARNIGETIALMTSLFQKQSDGKGDDIEVNEVVEFAVSLMSANTISKEGFKYLQSVCATDEKGRVMPACFRTHFTAMFEQKYKDTDLDVKSKLPRFYSYLKNIEGEQLSDFIKEAEGFSRNCTLYSDGAEVPLNDIDLFMLTAGLISIEQTFTRFDRGTGDDFNNNILDVQEIMTAYNQVYKGSVKALMPKVAQGLSEYLFQYLIKHRKIPTTSQLIGFRLKRESKRASDATRATLATVLKTISLESEELKKNPYPCDSVY